MVKLSAMKLGVHLGGTMNIWSLILKKLRSKGFQRLECFTLDKSIASEEDFHVEQYINGEESIIPTKRVPV